MRVAGIDYKKRSPYICSFGYCLNLPENLPASRNVLSLAIIYVRRHRGRTLFGDWRSHRSLSARYNRRSSWKLRIAGWRRWNRWIERSTDAGEVESVLLRRLSAKLRKDNGINFTLYWWRGSLDEGIAICVQSAC